MALGTAFLRNGHVYFVLSNPGPDGKVLCVNLTTLDDDCVDDECVLDANDYAWIKPGHPTVVAFSRSEVWDGAAIDQCLGGGQLNAPQPPVVPLATVAKVAAIGKTSRELSKAKRDML